VSEFRTAAPGIQLGKMPMSDRVLIPLLDGRWLALSSEAFEAALATGAAEALSRRGAHHRDVGIPRARHGDRDRGQTPQPSNRAIAKRILRES
jgi:hypothetical protein